MGVARVFVVQDDGSKDLVPASAMGDIVVLNTRSIPLFRDPAETLEAMRMTLVRNQFSPSDWLIPIGDPLLIGAAIYYAAMLAGGEVNCLKWDSRHRKYFPVKLKLKPTIGA
jgi:hypothetical protein